ncbi:MAG TPA: single-stranded DNA-binding protein [Bacteroidales bacterium]|nr:single-stranded DNA-binding protein [Bacteroidales bacterium]
MSVNKVILVGNVGKDPDVRYIDTNVPVARFPFATSETYRSRDGEKITTTEWHNVVLWRGLAEVAEKFVKKGSQLFIEGKIRTRSYDDRDGNKKYITEIIADNMQMLGRRSDSQASDNEDIDSSYSEPGSQSASSKNGSASQADDSFRDTNNTPGINDEPDDLPF